MCWTDSLSLSFFLRAPSSILRILRARKYWMFSSFATFECVSLVLFLPFGHLPRGCFPRRSLFDPLFLASTFFCFVLFCFNRSLLAECFHAAGSFIHPNHVSLISSPVCFTYSCTQTAVCPLQLLCWVHLTFCIILNTVLISLFISAFEFDIGGIMVFWKSHCLVWCCFVLFSPDSWSEFIHLLIWRAGSLCVLLLPRVHFLEKTSRSGGKGRWYFKQMLASQLPSNFSSAPKISPQARIITFCVEVGTPAVVCAN